MAKNPGWDTVERGVWNHLHYGDAYKTKDGWWGSPPYQLKVKYGPFKTMQEAINKLESL